MNIKNLITKYAAPSLPWLVLASLGLLLILQHTDLLYRAQEQSLFLYTEQFFFESVSLPGGLLCYAAAFITQFFYYPILGVCMLVCMWGVSVVLLGKGMNLQCRLWGWLSFIPVSLCAIVAQTGYSLFLIKLQGFLVVPSLSVLLISVLLYISSKLAGYWQTGFVGLLALVCYPLMGAYGLLTPVILSLWSQKKVLGIVVSVALSFVSCMFYYYTHATVMMSQLVYAALPSLYIAKEWQALYAVPYISLLFGLFLPLVVSIIKTDKIKEWVAVGSALLSIVVIVVCNYNNNNFRRELRVVRAMEKGDWYGALEVLDDTKKVYNPTQQIVFARNLVLWRLGMLGDYAFSYITETQKSKAPFGLSLVNICGAQQYYYSAFPMLSYRWAMETSVATGWDVENLKMLSRSAIVVGEYELAKKYLNLLKKTAFHADWAGYYYSLAENPSLIAQDKDIMWLRSVIKYSNSLISEPGDSMALLYSYFANCGADDSQNQEMGMLSAMIQRDHKLFWERFFQYVKLNGNITQMPKHFQEAALLFATLDENQDLLGLPYSENVKRQFSAFKNLFNKYENLPDDQRSALLFSSFGRSYYYYYTLNRGKL